MGDKGKGKLMNCERDLSPLSKEEEEIIIEALNKWMKTRVKDLEEDIEVYSSEGVEEEIIKAAVREINERD